MKTSNAEVREEEAGSLGGAPSDDSAMPERAAPERIGRYQLCFELASGGMATVYLAKADGAEGFEKLVALKRIHRHLAKERDYVEMFLDEARIASRITHANVCSVFDFGESNGEYFIAMEYLVGEPLSRVYRRVATNAEQRKSPMLPPRMARIVADACEGLHAAHELKDANGDLLNVVHRDVSARNLFLTYDGVVQVVDFGIASARQRVHNTSTGQVKGTFPYMAPEQMTSGVADRRVDVWALGVVLWELLTLKRLFRRDTDVNTMYAVLSDEIRAPSDYRPEIPRELDEIVMKALQRDPAMRYQTAREMGQGLRKFLAHSNNVVGPVELSDWMGEIFPQGEARKTQLMEIARLAEVAVPAIPQDDSSGRYTAQQLAMLEAEARPTAPSPFRPAMIAMITGAVAMLGTIAMGGSKVEPQVQPAPAPVVVAPPPAPEPVAEPKLVEPPVRQEEVVQEEQPPEVVVKKKKKKRARPVVDSKEKGVVNMVTRGGWAYVYFRGRKLGTTPTKLTLPAGKQTLLLLPFGEGPGKTITVNVVADETRRKAISL